MTDAGAFLSRLTALLADAGIQHMLTGSFASTYHGTPRTTQDLDLVIDADANRLRALVALLSPEAYYVSEEAALDAYRRGAPFNVIDLATGWKADLILRKDREFSREEFARRLEGEVLGATVFIATAEDTILAKLEWALRGQSERQLRDVAGILAVATDLDHDYIERWLTPLGLGEIWHRALTMVD